MVCGWNQDRADAEEKPFSVRHPCLLPLKRPWQATRAIPMITLLLLQWVRQVFPDPLWVYSVVLLAQTPIESPQFYTDTPFGLIASGMQGP